MRPRQPNQSRPPATRRKRPWLRRLLVSVVLLPLLPIGFIAFAYFSANLSARGRTFDHPAAVPDGLIGLVLGTSDQIDGRENLYFRYRIDAAVELWKAGKVKLLIVSGDNRTQFYNEPKRMKAALVKRGVPRDRIVYDFAGLRTLDSVIRAKRIFGVDRVLVISQKFQNQRAICIARHHGMDAYGYNARDLGLRAGLKTRLREIGARVVMWRDLHLLDTEPHHLGDPIELPGTDITGAP